MNGFIGLKFHAPALREAYFDWKSKVPRVKSIMLEKIFT